MQAPAAADLQTRIQENGLSCLVTRQDPRQSQDHVLSAPINRYDNRGTSSGQPSGSRKPCSARHALRARGDLAMKRFQMCRLEVVGVAFSEGQN